MKLDGKWIGQYTYLEGYAESIKGKSVSFELNLISHGIEFEGNFSDDESREIFFENGFIKGFIENTYISFHKRYPKPWIIDDNGNPLILENEIHPEIEYQGELIDNQFKGTWEIRRYYQGEEGIFSMVLGSGTWFMRNEI